MLFRLQLKKLALIYGDSGYFEVTIAPKARTAGVYKFTGQILGSGTFTLGTPNLESGDFAIPIQCRNQDVTIDMINDAVLAASKEGPMADVLEYSNLPVVSTDIIGNKHSSIFGIKGAPVPPALMSADLKSEITGTFNFFTKYFGEPICTEDFPLI